MALTPFMNLNLPAVQQTLGPEWASLLNAALQVVDNHDHTSGKGVKVKTAGIDINADLNFANFRTLNVGSTLYRNNSSVLSGPSNSNSLHVANGNLYFTNNSGIAVQLTNGGSIVSTPAAVQSLGVTSINANLTIAPSDSFVVIITDTNAPRVITLPLASSVVAGRLYIIKDKDGLSNDNPISIVAQGSDLIDGSATFNIDSNKAATMIICDGASNWSII
jgi:hypothetical protein